MQLMPATIKDCGISQEDAFDPEKNIACGVKFLSTLHSRYGTWDKALAAYNWGPGNLDKAISRDSIGWKGLLPTETKRYLEKLLPTAMGAPMAEAPVASHPPVSIPNNDNFNRLPFEKQIDILNQAKTLANHASVENERLQRIHKEEVEKARLEIPVNDYMQEYEAEFIEGAGSVFRGVRDVLYPANFTSFPFQAENYNPDHIYQGGVDLARLTDFTVHTIVDMGQEKFKVTYIDKIGRAHV